MTTLNLSDLTIKQQQIVENFKGNTVIHPNLKAALRECLLFLKHPVGNPIVLVYGPAGVGKSTVLKEIHKYILNYHVENMLRDPGFIPIVGVEAVPSEKTFKWEDYFRRALQAIQEPLIDYKVIYDTTGVQQNDSGDIVVGKRASAAALRQALENALQYRRIKVLTIDEAEHLNNMVRGRAIEDQLNIIKSLANLSQTVHVLAGSYRILNFRNTDGQLSRRTINIEFPRYKINNKEDRKKFKSVLSQFLIQLNVNDHGTLVKKEWEMFYEHSIGCIGTLKDWMTQALIRYLVLGDDVIELRHFEESALSASQCLIMAREALEGERQLETEKNELNQLKNLLRGRGDSSSATPTSNGEPVSTTESNDKSVHKTTSNRKPGERLPQRDPVGAD